VGYGRGVADPSGGDPRAHDASSPTSATNDGNGVS
jgi:hypothetical protein